MKNLSKIAPFLLLLAAFSCKKSDPGNNTPDPFMSFTPGLTWQYRVTDNGTGNSTNYTLTSTSRDTLVGSRTYRVFTNSNGNTSEYYNQSGNEYYTFRGLGGGVAGGTQLELLYLKGDAAVGTTWSQSFNLTVPNVPLPIPITINYSIAEKGATRVVNNVTYNNVTRVNSNITSTLIPATGLTSDIQNYIAPKYGNIESINKININFSGITQNVDTKTVLITSTVP
jgi:hypothetical protein